MWVDKRPKSLDFKVQKSLKGLKKKQKQKPYKVTHQCEISDRHEKEKFLKATIEEKIDYLQEKNTSKITDF